MNVAVAGCLRSGGGRWTVASVRGSPYLASTFCSFSIIIKSLRAGITEQWNTAAGRDKIVINQRPTQHSYTGRGPDWDLLNAGAQCGASRQYYSPTI